MSTRERTPSPLHRPLLPDVSSADIGRGREDNESQLHHHQRITMAGEKRGEANTVSKGGNSHTVTRVSIAQQSGHSLSEIGCKTSAEAAGTDGQPVTAVQGIRGYREPGRRPSWLTRAAEAEGRYCRQGHVSVESLHRWLSCHISWPMTGCRQPMRYEARQTLTLHLRHYA